MGPSVPTPRLSTHKRRGPYQEDPVVLRVNRESREVALTHYNRRDPLHLRHWELRDSVKYCSYVDFKVDIAFFYDFEQFIVSPSPEDGMGCQYFSEHEMGMVERLWIVHDGIVNLGRDLTRWLDGWLPRFTALREMVVEVRGLKNCKGIVALGGGFWTVEEALDGIRAMGVERLYSFLERMGERGITWELPSLVVKDGENLSMKKRSGIEESLRSWARV